MAWSLSFGPEGWKALEDGLREMSRDDLINALTDDEFERVDEGDDETASPEDAAEALRQRLLPLPTDALVEMAYECCERTHTCDNGGWRVRIDRQGYSGVRLKV